MLPPALPVAAALLSGSALSAIGFTALYAQFMRRSDPGQGGVNFTLFQCLDGALSMALSLVAGIVAQQAGYGIFFGFSAILPLTAVLMLQWLVKTQAQATAVHARRGCPGSGGRTVVRLLCHFTGDPPPPIGRDHVPVAR